MYEVAVLPLSQKLAEVKWVLLEGEGRKEQEGEVKASLGAYIGDKTRIKGAYIIQTYRAICAHDNFEVAGDFDGTLTDGTFALKGDVPLTSISPEVVVAAQEDTDTVGGVEASWCDGRVPQLGGSVVIPFWWVVVSSGISGFVVGSPPAPAPSFDSVVGVTLSL
jgi:hypothetical protein